MSIDPIQEKGVTAELTEVDFSSDTKSMMRYILLVLEEYLFQLKSAQIQIFNKTIYNYSFY